MNIIYEVLNKYFNNNKYKTIFIIILSLIINFLKINIISFITANIIESIQTKKIDVTYTYFYYFVIISLIYIVLFKYYNSLQDNLLTKLRECMRVELIKELLEINNENFNNINFTKLNSPIFRISNTCYYVFNNIISTIIPHLTLLFIVSLYFFYKNYQIGVIFLIGNILVILYLFFNLKNIIDNNKKYEGRVTENESYIVEILNNIEKIIFRGKIEEETTILQDNSNKTIEFALNFYNNANLHSLIMNIIISLTIFLCIYFMIKLFISKNINVVTFITFFTILLLYRDTIINTIEKMPDIIEYIGRTDNVLNIFKDMKHDYENILYQKYNLNFDRIIFKNVSFKYKNTDKLILNKLNVDLKTDKIIGIIGLSGNGKSTFAKLLIKMNKCEGDIYIDDINIKRLDSAYIRKNIIYVHQNSRLFDIKIIENIMYGCNKSKESNIYLQEIMQFDKIKSLFKNIDFNKKAGMSGDNLSGGQRQVINIINGLISPSKILILDEPTNALDYQLKEQVIDLIKYFKKYKKCIIIISHDKDVFPLFDEKIEIM